MKNLLFFVELPTDVGNVREGAPAAFCSKHKVEVPIVFGFMTIASHLTQRGGVWL